MSREIKVGLMAIIAIIFLVWGYRYLKGTNLLIDDQVFYANYANIDNLKVSDPVYINGYQVGRVTDISLDPEKMQTLVVEMVVLEDINLPRNTKAIIYSDGIMGNKAINLDYTGICVDDCLESGAFLQGGSISLLKSVLLPTELDEYLSILENNIGGLIDTLNSHLMGEEAENTELGQMMMDFRQTISNLRSATYNMNSMFANSADEVESVLSNVEAITANLKENNDKIDSILGNTAIFTANLNNLDLEGTILEVKQMLDEFKQTVGTANATFASLESTTAKINSGQGSLGQLINDDQLHDRLLRISTNLDLLLQDVRLNPERYIKVSVFGKKTDEYEVPEEDPAFQPDTTQ